MNTHLKLALGSLVLLSLVACGGGGSDDSSSSSSSADALSGSWYSSATLATWQFSSNGKGVLLQGSTDGSACRVTYIDYTVNSSDSTVSYYITRARGLGANNTYDSGTVHQGPYSAAYRVNGSSATIGTGTYSRSSTFPSGCQNA
jgi:hypothetical protein